MKTTISFLKYRFVAVGFSIALGVAFSIGTAINGGFNMGIDFVGGVKVTTKFDRHMEEGAIRSSLQQLDATVQRIGQDSANEFIISVKGSSTDGAEAGNELTNVIQQRFTGVQLLSVETVGPAVGAYLRSSMIRLIIASVVFMAIYLTFRFEFKYSVGAMVALVHDVTLSYLFCGIAGVEINVPIIAALLTIFGFSVNDTIVIFDRIRENLRLKTQQSFRDVIDLSVNQSLSRTILTSLTVLLSILAIYLLGSKGLNDFAEVMLFGTVIGTYSTVYIASPVVMYWEKYAKKK
ncbi:MAG: protein translocase subunit SecF [Spirochaetes bacterium]|nr:protein translocase subunit SecF [Spirochaetota bacterium]